MIKHPTESELRAIVAKQARAKQRAELIPANAILAAVAPPVDPALLVQLNVLEANLRNALHSIEQLRDLIQGETSEDTK